MLPEKLTPSRRVLSLLVLLLAQPYRYTRRELEVRFQVSEDTIQRDLKDLEAAGITYEYDAAHRYAVLPQGQAKMLQRLQTLTAEERTTLMRAANSAFANPGHAQVVQRKLESLQDFQRLGLRALRSPALAKIDALERALQARVCVRLEDYRSTNSGEVSSRLVEGFYLDTANGIVHAYDLSRRALRHFRLDRMVRVDVLNDMPWQHKDAHVVEHTDAFRIVSRETVRVHLRMGVAAYNNLSEHFPGARAHVEPGHAPDTYDFDAQVNAAFRGVGGFVLGNAGDVEVLEPIALLEDLQQRSDQLFRPLAT